MFEELASWWFSEESPWPFWIGQSAGIFFLTFITEDLACFGAALLVHTGLLPWWLGAPSAFGGIWLGDLLLYLLARGSGDRLRRWRWARRWLDSPRVRESEAWFRRRGVALLWICRVLPGTRLPTYLAAGFVRVPARTFLIVTGAAAAVWTAVMFGMVWAVSATFGDRIDRLEYELLWLGGIGLLLFLGLRWGLQRLTKRAWVADRLEKSRWTRWEFWPAWLFYVPVVCDYLWLGLRHWGLSLPTAANPGIVSGGIVGESKLAMLEELTRVASDRTAQAWAIDGGNYLERLASFQGLMKERSLAYPVIVKPDIGQRGSGIRKVASLSAAEECLKPDGFARILQRYVPGPSEAGIFYYRYPGEAKGRILGITYKVFPELIGDGASTLRELIRNDPRASILAEVYCRRFRPRLDWIPASGEAVRLVEAGNHAQGCIFQDGQFLRTEALENRIDEISRKVAGFYVGRYDVRYRSDSLLKAGEGFQIIELNGAASEATQIYDPKYSLFDAYRTLHRQWKIVFEIGARNRKRGVRPMPLRRVWKLWRQYRAMAARHLPAD